MKHKFLSLCVALLAATNLFADKIEVDNFYYYLDDDNLTASVAPGRWGASGPIIIPASISYNSKTYSVTTIGDYAFRNCSGLTSVTIPNSVTTIGEEAFYGCSGLTSVTINSVTTIGERAFYGCSGLTSVTISSVTTIGDNAFYGCSSLTKTNYIGTIADWCKIKFGNDAANPVYDSHNLYINNVEVKDLVIPEGVDTIGNYAFYSCTGLTSVTIGNFVTTVGERAFYGCSGLTSVTIGNSVTTIGIWAFSGCRGLTSVTIGNSVTTIGNYAFWSCSGLTSVTIGNSVTTVGARAFESCSGLTSVTIPNSVTTIGDYAFQECSGLTSVEAPAIFFDVPEDLFLYYTKQLQNVIITSGELTENELLFLNRSYKTLRNLDVSATTNTSLADEAFKGCYNLETLLLPAQLEYIPYMAVAGCKNLKNIDIPASVEEIEQSAFEDCRSIQTITFGGVASANSSARMATNETSQLKKIGNWAFYNAHELQHLDIPEGVEEIGDAAFYGCTYLQDLTLPSSVRTIGDNCFALCSKLQQVSVSAVTPPSICARTFYDVNRAIPVYVPDEAVDSYKSDIYWKEFDIQGGTTDLDQLTDSPTHRFTKIIKDNRLLIRHNGNLYNAAGHKMR